MANRLRARAMFSLSPNFRQSARARPPHNMLYVDGHLGMANPLATLRAISYTESGACLTRMLNACMALPTVLLEPGKTSHALKASALAIFLMEEETLMLIVNDE